MKTISAEVYSIQCFSAWSPAVGIPYSSGVSGVWGFIPQGPSNRHSKYVFVDKHWIEWTSEQFWGYILPPTWVVLRPETASCPCLPSPLNYRYYVATSLPRFLRADRTNSVWRPRRSVASWNYFLRESIQEFFRAISGNNGWEMVEDFQRLRYLDKVEQGGHCLGVGNGFLFSFSSKGLAVGLSVVFYSSRRRHAQVVFEQPELQTLKSRCR